MNHKTIISTLIALAFTLASSATITPDAQLSAAEAQQVSQQAVAQWKETKKQQLEAVKKSKCCSLGGLKMPYDARQFGNERFGDRSLWISLHGGGSAPASVNNQQWKNQKHLYEPHNGIYVAPRAPWDDWDMWFKNPIDDLFEQLILTMVCHYGVNPDKVYLLGYSAGGDGVWRMAPRMADHWAAASMMAGHPGDVQLMSLRNVPFMIWCGADDAAYNRNDECRSRGVVMDSLQAADPEGYIHSTHIVAGKGHWMDLEDKAALPWMERFTRNPYPKCVKWCQGDRPRPYFYWLGVDEKEAKKSMKLTASIQGNTIEITQCDYAKVSIYLNDQMLDLDKEVTITHNGRVLFQGKLPRTQATITQTLNERNDPAYTFPAMVTITL